MDKLTDYAQRRPPEAGPISSDRNDPETVSWLDVCRRLRPDLTREEFEKQIPDFITAGQRLQADNERRKAH